MSLRQQVDIVFNDLVTSEEDNFSKGVSVMWGYRRFINPKTGQEDYKRIMVSIKHPVMLMDISTKLIAEESW